MFNQIRDISLEAVSALLAFFYALPVVGGSYGVAIILLTVAVMIILMPLTLKATRSTIKMTQLQPQLRALQKEYKDDRQTLNQEMMALYQSNGVNPVGGCLPMLAQLPVFLLLFNVLRGLSRRVSDLPYYTLSTRAQEIATGQPVDPALADRFDPQYLDRDSELFISLSGQNEIGFGPFDLSARSWDVLLDNVITSIPYLLLIAFVVFSSYYQQRQISARRGAVPDNPTPQQQTQQQLLRILPLMSGIWSFLFPAGLVLYWATSNLFRIGQQAYISRALYSEDGEGTAAMKAAEEAKQIADSDSDSGAGGSDDGEHDGSVRGKATAGSGGGGKNGARPKSNRSGRSEAKSGANGGQTNGSSGSSDQVATPGDRNEAWARKRAERVKAKPARAKKPSSGGGPAGSSRVTPKGTKPGDAKKKRKR